MPNDPLPGTNEISQTPGLAGGPGPTPPGVSDGTPTPTEGDDEGTAGVPRGAQAQKQAGEVAERSAGTRQADVRQGAGDGDAAEDAAARKVDEARDEAWERAARRDPEEPDPS
jgi:hypothetical protein